MTNVDRTARNVNLLVWHRRLWLIDHGAALYVQHTWSDPAAHARRSFPRIADHVLLPYAGSIAAADERLAPRLVPELLGEIAGAIPAAWLADGARPPGDGSTEAHREAYVAYLLRRLEGPRPFVEEADRARLQA